MVSVLGWAAALAGTGLAQDAPSAEIPGTGEAVPSYEETFAGWETERLAETAKERLGLLKPFLSQPAGTAFPGEEVADEEFRGTVLRPADLESLAVDAAFEVRRLAAGSAPAAAEGRGAGGLRAALEPLLHEFSPEGPLHPLIKIVRAALEGEAGSTRVLFHLSGPLREGGVREVNAEWDCRWADPASDAPRLASVTLAAYEETTLRNPAGTLFSESTEAVLGGEDSFREQMRFGLDHWLARIDSRVGILVGGWTGLAVGDADGDGLEDLYVCQPAGLPNRLYLQNADGTARDASAASGLDWVDTTRGALFVDLDNDGDQDLVISQSQGILFQENDGRGVFTVQRAEVLPAGVPYSLAAADYDADGDLDVYVCCYNQRGLDRNNSLARPVPYHDANNGGRNVLLRNDGSFRFRHVTRETGLDENNERYSYAASWEDYDDDGDLDLYVANDFGRNNLYRQDRDASGAVRFVDVAEAAGVLDIAAGMSAAWGDADNDGRMDLYVGNMFSSAGNRIATQDQFLRGKEASTRSLFLRHARGNSLFRNLGPDARGEVRFDDVSEEAGVTLGRWAWGSLFADINNDGREDILVANGFITQPDTGDL